MGLFLRIFWRLIAYGLLLIGGVSLYVFLTSIRPPRHITGVTPADLGLAYEDVKLLTEDNIELAAWFIPGKTATKKAIIVCHGYPADKGDVLSWVSFLHEKFHLLLFDFRAMGQSGGKITSAGWREKKDFLAGVKYLKSRGMERIGALGFSMGGAVIIMSNSPQVDAIVSESAYANLEQVLHVMYRKYGVFRYPFIYATGLWSRLFLGVHPAGVSPQDCIHQIEVPIFLIHSERDSQIPVQHAYALKRANPNAELWVINEADHGGIWASRWSEYESRIFDFFSILDQ